MTDNLHIPDPSGILAVHASAVRTNGGALIFLGPSKTGKSTICRLLSLHTPPMADDAVYLIPRAGGEWKVAKADGRIFRGPLSEQEITRLHSVPLRAIFRLYQASVPCLKRIDELSTCRCLTDALFEIERQRNYNIETKRLAFSSLAEIVRSVPGYHLYFDRSSQTLEVINEEVGLWLNPTRARPIHKV